MTLQGFDPYDQLRDTYRNVRLYVDLDQREKDFTQLLDEEISLESTLLSKEKEQLKNEKIEKETLDNKPHYEKRFKNKLFKPSVSFNTVPTVMGYSSLNDEGVEFEGVQIPYTMEDFYDNEGGDNPGYMPENSYITSSSSSHSRVRHSSPPPKLTLASVNALASMFKVAQNGKIVRVDYPSRPTISNDSIIINSTKKNWSIKWEQRKLQMEKRIQNKEKYFQDYQWFFPAPEKIPTTLDGYTPLPKAQRKREMILKKKVGFPNWPRTVCCHISGRRHTWVALDWTVTKFLQDTDHLVIITNVPKDRHFNSISSHHDKDHKDNKEIDRHIHHTHHSYSDTNNDEHSLASKDKESLLSTRPVSLENMKFESTTSLHRTCTTVDSNLNNKTIKLPLSIGSNFNEKIQNHEQFEEWCSGYSKGLIKQKLTNIFNYVITILPKDKDIKITIEFVVESTKKALIDATNIYTPDLFVTSTLRWERTSNLVHWKSKNLTDVLVTAFPVPTIIIPTKRMFEFESNLQEQFQLKYSKDDGKCVSKNEKSKKALSTPTHPSLLHSNTAPIGNDIIIKKDRHLHPIISKDSKKLEKEINKELDDQLKSDLEEELEDEIKSKKTINTSKDNSSSTDSLDTYRPTPDQHNEMLSIKSELSQHSLKDKIHEFAKNHRINIRNKIEDLNNNKDLQSNEKNQKKIDLLLTASFQFIQDIENFNDNVDNETERDDTFDLKEFKRILTGEQDMHSGPKKSMLDVLGNNYSSDVKRKSPLSPATANSNFNTSPSLLSVTPSGTATPTPFGSKVVEPYTQLPKNLPRAPKNMKIPRAHKTTSHTTTSIENDSSDHIDGDGSTHIRKHQHYTLSNRKSKTHESHTNPQIKFADGVKHKDGKSGLGHAVNGDNLSRSESPERNGKKSGAWNELKKSISNSSKTDVHNNDKISLTTSGKLKKKTSRDSLKKSISNDSSSSDKKSSGGGWFSFWRK
ncbi:hypothetical protein TBLA_0J00770 [Henningerozyma blattae CBS 6284]|uniref:Uncharacterized protein n=1 Tax=Henningerozyma blattae (strain ATCC 34711 / CBS 6284 / DSM 70876 / NBRC 10599 / NRRL Y-10934 / UCD 77-7) TaxID=1071380 RepID=I2H9M3_HENB6|nr:hypothetical protein TBLA_0J00770 [Tetrapisispora blattae CBS 6284]CCH63075.1 hypothetical protein TBLA_0J00770 [Tetrapisispora blattae CBS 6284]